MARKAKSKITINGKTMLEHRRSLGLNQSQFWSPLGVTQSGGSRYESGRSIPKPVRKLIYLLYYTGLALDLRQLDEMDAV